MAKKATKNTDRTLTSAHRLGSLVRSARDIVWKDNRRNGDLDQLPAQTWVMFASFFDDQERIEGERAKRKWRDWLVLAILSNAFNGKGAHV